MTSKESDQVADLRAVLDQSLVGEIHHGSALDGPRVYREGDLLPPAAQAGLDRRDPAELDRRWREVTGQA
ncbi:MAG: hypothetical protein WBM50_02620 [Acidimicrobiales bacterium]